MVSVRRAGYLSKAHTLAGRLGRVRNGHQGGKVGVVTHIVSEAKPPPRPEPTSLLEADDGLPFYVTDPARLPEVVSALELAGTVGLDLETTGLRWWKDEIRLVSLTTESGD